ncbi:MAG: hypothetical protein AAB592_05150 [Patescibacteria group bacterium]
MRLNEVALGTILAVSGVSCAAETTPEGTRIALSAVEAGSKNDTSRTPDLPVFERVRRCAEDVRSVLTVLQDAVNEAKMAKNIADGDAVGSIGDACVEAVTSVAAAQESLTLSSCGQETTARVSTRVNAVVDYVNMACPPTPVEEKSSN